MFVARVFIGLKPTVNDPQGQTIEGGLRQLGFDTVSGVRVGKYLTITLHEASEDAAARKVKEMCEKLLANPVIEDYHFELEQVEDA